MNQDAAQTIALQALSFLIEDDERLGGFMGATGIDADDLRRTATDPDMLGGVLDYLLAFEPLLMEFSDHANLPPEDAAMARQALPGYMPPM